MSDATLIALISCGASIIGMALAGLTFWMKIAAKLAIAEADAESSAALARDAKVSAAEAHQRVDSVVHDFGLYRERVAQEYASQTMITQLEARLTRAIEHLAQTSSDAIDRLGVRLDQTRKT